MTILNEIQKKVFANLMQSVNVTPDLSAYEKAFGIEKKIDRKLDFYNWYKRIGGDISNSERMLNAINKIV